MTGKEYLSQIRTINIRLKSMARQVQSLEDALTSVSPVISDMPRSPSPNLQRMESLIAAKVDLEREMDAESAKLADITRTINSLPDSTHSAILTSRYISRMEWREIANELYVSEGRAYQLHRDALAEIEKIIASYSSL